MPRKDIQPTIPATSPRVTARPVDTYVEPAEPTLPPIGPTTAEQLARSLSGFNNALGDLYQHSVKVGKEEAEAVALKKINGMTLEEANEAVRNGTMAAEHSPWAQAAFEKLYGRRLANETTRNIKAAIANGEIGPDDDLDAIFAERTAADMEGIESRFFQSGYGAVAAEGREQANAVLAEIKTDQFVQERNATILESMRADVDAGRATGKTDEQIVKDIFDYTATNKAFFNIPHRETDKMLLALATKYAAEGEEGLAKAILTSKRASNTPSIADNPAHGLRVARILALAEREGFEQRQVKYQDLRVSLRSSAAMGELNNASLVEGLAVGAISTDEAEDLRVRNIAAREAEQKRLASEKFKLDKDKIKAAHIEQFKRNFASGLGFTNHDLSTPIAKPDGTATTVKTEWAQETSDAAFAEVLAEDPQIQSTDDPELIVRRAIRLAEANGMPFPFSPWRQTLAAGPIAASAALVDPKGEVPAAARQSLKLYMLMRATSPALLEKHQPSDSRGGRFHRIAATLIQYRGLDEDAAIVEAVRLTQSQDALPTARASEIEKAATTLDTGSSWFGGEKVKNRAEVSRALRDVAKTYALTLSADEAVKAAKDDLEQAGTVINGWYVRTNGMHTAFVGALPEITKTEVASYIEKFGADQGYTDPDVLVLAPHLTGGGVWTIRDMSRGGRPMVDSEGRIVMLRTSDLLERHRQSISDAALARRADVNAEQNRDRAKRQERAKRIFLRRMPWEAPVDDENEGGNNAKR